MAPLRDRLPRPGRYFDAPGLVGAFDGFIRFRYISVAGLAHDNLSSILVGFLDNVHLQRDHAAANVGSCFPPQLGNRLFLCNVRKCRDVV